MSIQYSISYDETGSPSLVKNTIEGPKQVVRTSFNIGKFEPTRTRTISDFANVSSFDDIKAERGVEPVTKSLQKYVYQQTSNSDGDPDDTTQSKTFSQMDFEAKAARGPDGKIKGGLTFLEQMKVDAQAFSEKKSAQTILGFTDFGTISGLFARYGKSVTLDEYREDHPDYYTTGFGRYTPPSERTGLTRAQKEAISIDKQQRLGIDSGTGIKDPSDYLQDQAAKERQIEFSNLQNEIGRALHGGGNGGNQSGGDLSATEGSF